MPIKAEIRRVLIVLVVEIIFADTSQFGSLVRPARCTNGLLKVTTLESKVKSPWNPTKLAPLVVVLLIRDEDMCMRTTPDGEPAMVATGRETVIGNVGQVGVGEATGAVAVAVTVGVNVAVAVAVGVKVAVGDAPTVAVGVGDAPPAIVIRPLPCGVTS